MARKKKLKTEEIKSVSESKKKIYKNLKDNKSLEDGFVYERRLQRASTPIGQVYPNNERLVMDKYEAVCKACGDTLCEFKSETGKLIPGHAYSITLVEKFDNERWYGAVGVNINEKGMLNFECGCGNRVRKEPRYTKIYKKTGVEMVKNYKRYTEIKIKKVK